MRKWFVFWMVLGAAGSGLLWLMGADTSTPGSAMPIGGLFQLLGVGFGLACMMLAMF